MAFTDDEAAYLYTHPMGRLSTVDSDGQPDAVPVAVEFDGASFWIGGGGTVTRTRKFRNIAAGHDRVALVIDDTPSLEPLIVRGIRIYGRAEQPFEREGMVGPGTYLRVTPTLSWSWNLAGEPAPDDRWYETRRTVHESES